MNRAPFRAGVLLAAILGVGSARSTLAQAADEPATDAPVVEQVEIARNQFLQKDTLLFYISTKPGDRYDELRLKEDFRRLWDTGFVDDLTVDVRDTPTGGKIVTFVVSERKRIEIVDYRGSKALTNTTIEDELKKKEASLKIDTFYDLGKARHVETILKDMLAEKGRPFATVHHDAKPVGTSGLQVSFVIDDGPKARIEQIAFSGADVFHEKTLRGRMKNLKAHGFWNMSWLLGKTTYTPEKWSGPEGDQKRLEDFYLDHGYVTAQVGEPKVTYIDEKGGKKPRRGIRLDIPVSEGEQYRVGDVKFEGMTVFKPDLVLPIFKLQKGEVYREAKIKKGFDKLRDAYGAQGYFQWTGRPERKPDPARKVVDVTLAMEEDKRYYVGKITFTGNTSTRDKVIRREVYLNEADVFNTEALKLSIRRINQLGYFKPMEGAPELGPSTLGEDRIDVTFKVEEQNRNQFTFGGGVSGLEGTFLNASFSTANFLGLGETVQLSAQAGARTKNYQLAVTEPYLFDRPITAGFDLYSRKIDYLTSVNVVGYSEVRTGASRHRRAARRAEGLPPPLLRLHVRGDRHRDPRQRQGGVDVGAAPGALDPGGADVLPVPRRGTASGEPHQPFARLQHRGQPLHAAPRDALHGLDDLRGRAARRERQLRQAGFRGDRLRPSSAQDRARASHRGGLDPPLRQHPAAPLLPALLPRG